MDCPRELIKSYAAADTVEPHALQILQKHLALCPSCRALFDQERALTAALQALPQIPVPPDFSREILYRIQALSLGSFAGAGYWRPASIFVLAVLLVGGV